MINKNFDKKKKKFKQVTDSENVTKENLIMSVFVQRVFGII